MGLTNILNPGYLNLIAIQIQGNMSLANMSDTNNLNIIKF
jgi:hypothetical protein